MSQCVDCCQSLSWIHFQQLLYEVYRSRRGLTKVSLLDGVQSMDLGKLHAQKSWIFQESLIVIGCKRAQAFLDEEQLIELVFPREHWISIDEFPKNATDSPKINFLPIGRPNKQLGRAIPPSGHIVRQFLLPSLLKLPCKAKIAYFQLLSVTDEQVLRFYISVKHVEGVHVGQSLEQLVEEQSDDLGVQSIRRFLQNFQQIVLHILKNKIDNSLLPESLLQLDYVGMLQHLEDLYFSHCSLLYYLVFF